MNGTPGLRRTGPVAPVLRWLLWTRRRALTSVLVGLVASIVLARTLASLNAPTPPTPPPASAPVVAAPTTSSPPPEPDPRDAPAPGTAPDTVAARFAARWVEHEGVDPARWMAALQPLCTEAYGEQILPTVDPATVPANRVTGPARVIRRDRRSAEVSVRLDQLTIRVSLLETTGDQPTAARWRVNDVNPG